MNQNETIAALVVVAFIAFHLGKAQAAKLAAKPVDTTPIDPYAFLGWTNATPS